MFSNISKSVVFPTIYHSCWHDKSSHFKSVNNFLSINYKFYKHFRVYWKGYERHAFNKSHFSYQFTNLEINQISHDWLVWIEINWQIWSGICLLLKDKIDMFSLFIKVNNLTLLLMGFCTPISEGHWQKY